MVFKELVKTLKKDYKKVDVSDYEGLLAIQFDITGKHSGTFYVEIKDGEMSIEPYEYIDNQAVVTVSEDSLERIFSKTLDPVISYTIGKVKIKGNKEKVKELSKMVGILES